MTDLEAYQAFMLRGKGAVHVVKQPISSGTEERNSSGGSGKKNKSDVVVLRAFQGRLQEWKDTDSQLEAVVGSVANLRDRIWWETQQMETKRQALQKPWEECSFRPSLVSAMTLEDIQLALTHDLLQHEKMMVNGRKLIANLAQTQDGMGRRLDEWMMMNHDSALSRQGLLRLEQAQDIYGWLAEKLYARQELLKAMLDSSHDGLVTKEGVDIEEGSRVVIRKVLREWKYDNGLMRKLVDEMLAA